MMTPLFKKLNYKDQQQIVVADAPKSFDVELKDIKSHAKIIKHVDKVEEVEFIIGFVTTQIQINTLLENVFTKLKGDAVLWICYPKMTSKNYTCDFNRDTGWQVMAKYNLEPVRQVAIDQDFSALRFRKVEFIKTITRRESFAITTDAKKRTTQKGK
jgi:hypothetical protein